MEFVGPKISFKEPKTERSRRTIALPASVVLELKAHRKAQAEHCLKCGFGRSELVFPRWDGKPHNPDRFGEYFKREVLGAKLPRVTFHSLRHTHITCLLRSGVPVHVVSASRPCQSNHHLDGLCALTVGRSRGRGSHN